MKYVTVVVIDVPRDRVVELFDDADNLAMWQPGLQSFEHVSGEPGQVGAISRLIYDEGGRRTEMMETITRRDLPGAFDATYEAQGVKNWISNRFVEEGPGRTCWVLENEFQFSGLMRVLALFMRRAFPRQTQKTMEDFKAFAEGS